MLGFPTAFTLMGMGVFFGWLAYRSVDPASIAQILDLMVQRTFSVMSNDVLISIPLFVFMGYVVERANTHRQAVQEPAPGSVAAARRRWRWLLSSPAPSSPPPPASSARW